VNDNLVKDNRSFTVSGKKGLRYWHQNRPCFLVIRYWDSTGTFFCHKRSGPQPHFNSVTTNPWKWAVIFTFTLLQSKMMPKNM